jgi:hypothetical protein
MSATESARSANYEVPEHLNRQVSMYSLAAAAAGVSLCALTTPATAEVVVTRTHLPITHSAPVMLDLNKDGIPDFKFTLNSAHTSYFYDNLTVCADLCGIPGNKVMAAKANVFVYASDLMRGAKIGPSAHFNSSILGVTVEGSFGDFLSSRTDRTVYGNWGNDPQNRYLGVKFQIKGETHFGWVRMTVTSDKVLSITGTITGYAYETVPNKPIVAGTAATSAAEALVGQQSGASLGMLASGADGLALWRSKGDNDSRLPLVD